MLSRLLFSFFTLTIIHLNSDAQPYIDPLQLRYLQPINSSSGDVEDFSHLWIGTDIPIGLGKNSYLVLSPAFERWHFDLTPSPDPDLKAKGITFPVGLIGPVKDSTWSYILIAAVRSNGEELFAENTFQYGGVALASYNRTKDQSFRLGVYVNKEFFGWFIMPLLGIDWRINDRNYVFGVLPGRFTYEHKFNEKLFGGFTFRAPTNSYRLKDGRFARVEDNQISLFLDYYLMDKFCITLEPGFGVARKLRYGINNRDYMVEKEWQNGLFVKLSAAYRIRL